MTSIRCGSGLGDSLYLQSIARHLVQFGYRPEVCSDWPDVFRPLWGRIEVSKFRRDRIDRVAHYSLRRGVVGTTQFEDCCINAAIPGKVDLRLDWVPVNPEWLAQFTAKPIVLVQMPRAPFARKDGYGKELLPDCAVIQRAINYIRGRAFLIQVGSGPSLYEFSGIDLDLSNRTSVTELLDLASISHGFLGFCSYFVPLAESLMKPALLVWSRKGLMSKDPIIRQITPTKILHRASSRYIVDDCSDNDIARAVDALLEQAGSQAAV